MSQENVEVVRQSFSYWGRGDWRSGGELLDPNWELVFSAGWFVDPGTYRASDASHALKEFLESWEDFRACAAAGELPAPRKLRHYRRTVKTLATAFPELPFLEELNAEPEDLLVSLQANGRHG
ncbi:MAG: hypothetical protein ACRDMH_04435 [Solirubrobacterales bacterium]